MPYPLGHGAYDMAIGQITIILCLTSLKPVHRRVVLHRAACPRFMNDTSSALNAYYVGGAPKSNLTRAQPGRRPRVDLNRDRWIQNPEC